MENEKFHLPFSRGIMPSVCDAPKQLDIAQAEICIKHVTCAEAGHGDF
jgi:hypothetical protein